MSHSNLINRCWRLYAAEKFALVVQEAEAHVLDGASPMDQQEIHYVWGLALWRLEKVRPAARKIRQLLDINPNSASGHLQLANMLDDMERFDEAARHYATAAQLAPDSAAVAADWAIMLYRANQIDEALEKFDEAERLCADDAFFHLYRGLCLENAGDLEGAVADLEIYFQHGHREPFALARLGVLYLEMEQHERAEKLLREALAADPEEPAHLYHLALCLKRVGQFEEAETLAFRLIEADAHNDESWGLLGDLELERGNVDAAIDRYEKSLSINPHGSHTLSGLAWVHYRKEDHEVARQLSLQALRCDPANLSALDLLRQMEPSVQRLCRYVANIHGETAEGTRFYKSVDCLAGNPELAGRYIGELQHLFKDEVWWEIVEIQFVEPITDDHPGVVWISDYSFCS